jgi:hypothetical protein
MKPGCPQCAKDNGDYFACTCDRLCGNGEVCQWSMLAAIKHPRTVSGVTIIGNNTRPLSKADPSSEGGQKAQTIAASQRPALLAVTHAQPWGIADPSLPPKKKETKSKQKEELDQKPGGENQIMVAFRKQAGNQYPPFPPGVKIGPDVWDRVSPEPILQTRLEDTKQPAGTKKR